MGETVALDLRGVATAAQKPAAAQEPLTPREMAWSLTYRDPEGVEHRGTLLSQPLTAGEFVQASQNAAALAGCPWERLPGTAQARIWAMAVVALQVRQPRPVWFDRWAADDETLLFTVYGLCDRHNSDFFRAGDPTGPGSEVKPRVVVAPVVPPGGAVRSA